MYRSRGTKGGGVLAAKELRLRDEGPPPATQHGSKLSPGFHLNVPSDEKRRHNTELRLNASRRDNRLPEIRNRVVPPTGSVPSPQETPVY